MNFWNEKNILITGGDGFLGKHVVKKLTKKGARSENIIIPKYPEFNLTEYDTCLELTKNIDIVIHLAAKVGGILFHKKNPGSMLYENLKMGINLIEACRINGVGKIINIGSTASYPSNLEPPFVEDKIWDGYPDEVTSSYGIAKRLVMELGIKYKEEYGTNSVFLMPVNLYGPGDNFIKDDAQVIPSLIDRISLAKSLNEPSVIVWGTGKATREFVFVEDVADAILLAAEKYDDPYPINIGTGIETPVKKIVETICEIINFNGDIIWDTSKPDGTLRRCVNIEKAEKLFGFKAFTSIETGLTKTIDWFNTQK